MMAVHYAPNTVAFLCPQETLTQMVDELCSQGKQIGLLTFSAQFADLPCQYNLQLPAVAEHYETAFYNALRELDNLALDHILIEQPPATEAWAAVNDRLEKATV